MAGANSIKNCHRQALKKANRYQFMDDLRPQADLQLDVREPLLFADNSVRVIYSEHLFRQQGDHKYAYDLETLSKVLEEAGFTAVTGREFDSQLDNRQWQWGSLYVQARKPN